MIGLTEQSRVTEPADLLRRFASLDCLIFTSRVTKGPPAARPPECRSHHQ